MKCILSPLVYKLSSSCEFYFPFQHTYTSIAFLSSFYFRICFLSNGPVHVQPNNKTFVTSKDSDQHIHLPSMVKVLVYSSLNSDASNIVLQFLGPAEWISDSTVVICFHRSSVRAFVHIFKGVFRNGIIDLNFMWNKFKFGRRGRMGVVEFNFIAFYKEIALPFLTKLHMELLCFI